MAEPTDEEMKRRVEEEIQRRADEEMHRRAQEDASSGPDELNNNPTREENK